MAVTEDDCVGCMSEGAPLIECPVHGITCDTPGCDLKGGPHRPCHDPAFTEWRDSLTTKAREEAVLQFAQWVASNRAYNGSPYESGQALYNERLNGLLPEWAREWLEEKRP